MQSLIEEITVKVTEREARLKLLGEPQSRSSALRTYLDRIASQLQIISLQDTDGNYSHDVFGGWIPED
jgi:hypothetical protein